PRLGERACAVVVPTDGQQLSLSDITDFLERKGFAKQFLPEGLRIVDALPRPASGKVQKYVLIQQFSQ
uniref:AMP-binding enzyme n=1 Tax=Klebsiella pneumoniae TaxID=573 RepID=UPI003F75C964